MAKPKRQREEPTPGEVISDVHPARQKRLKRTKDDAGLAVLYEELANEVQEVRIKAAAKLLKYITQEPEELEGRLVAAEKRLTLGLCSGRKAARLGFSIALAEVFRLKFKRDGGSAGSISLQSTIDGIISCTQLDLRVSGQERREYSLGRRFAYQAMLHSDIGLRRELSADQWSALINSIFELANEKAWLRRDVGSMLYDYLVSPAGSRLSDDRVAILMETAGRKKLLKTAEGVGLWLAIQHHFPNVSLPSSTWHHNDPLSSKEHQIVAKIMLDDSDDVPAAKRSGSRQASPSFAWTVILRQLNDGQDAKRFRKFWEHFTSLVFSSASSTERKALGLQIFTFVITEVPLVNLPTVLHPSILRCILDQRAKPDNHLFEAAKIPLNNMVARAKREPPSASVLVGDIIDKGAVNLDQQTKTKTMESIVAAADDQSLMLLVFKVQEKCFSHVSRTVTLTDTEFRGLGDLLLSMVRTHKDAGATLTMATETLKIKEDFTWLEHLLDFLSVYAITDKELVPFFQPRLMSILNVLMSGPLRQALQAPVIVVKSLRHDGNALKQLRGGASDAVSKAWTCMDKMYTHDAEQSLLPGNEAFALLFALSMLQCFRHEPDAVAALEDLVACFMLKDSSDDATAMMIELLLSFISKPSALFRKLAEQVFAAFAPEITADSLQSLIDILGQKESLSGQQELFDAHGNDDQEEPDESGDDDVEVMDVEDASDVELINGEQASASASEDDSDEGDEGSSSDTQDGADENVDDEEAAFDKKLAEALRTERGGDEDSDDDGSVMNDEQMLALEPHLTSIFKERQKTTSKKQDKKDAKENIVNFKNRVLDLLAIYVKAQYAEFLTLDLILPLTTLVRTTTSRQTGEKAFSVLKQYFDTCSKNKKLPQPDDSDAIFSLLSAVHAEMKLGGSKVHSNACSRSSLFLAKVLVALDPAHYERIASMYANLMSEWWQDPTNKVHPSVFSEWSSWSIATRKQL